ncbi:hypothetical protein N8987_03805 [Crocinitomix sp.]|nr:hypothetical protein [Crocinitomix sp.]
MRIFFACLLISVVGVLNGQTVYGWINRQYNPDYTAEYANDEFLYLKGKVSQVNVTIDFLNPDNTFGYRKEFYTYSKTGNIKKIEVIEPDGSGYMRCYFYNDKDAFDYDLSTYFLEESGLIDTLQVARNSTSKAVVLADSIRTNTNGDVIYYRQNSNEVYSNYDTDGRKVLDSIPAAMNVQAHEISYIYRRNKIKKRYYFPAQELHMLSKYWLDEQGNWIKVKLKHNKRKWNVIAKREIVYFND